MRYLIPVMIFCQTSFGIEQDKIEHFATSAFLSGFVYGITYIFCDKDTSALKRALVTTAIVLSIGALKEATDDHFDMGDMKANALGVGAVVLPLTIINW